MQNRGSDAIEPAIQRPEVGANLGSDEYAGPGDFADELRVGQIGKNASWHPSNHDFTVP